MKALAGALSILVAAPSAAQVRDWPSAGGYDITQTEPSCMMSAEYPIEGRSPIKFYLLMHEAGVYLALTSWDWSAQDEAEYTDITIAVDGFLLSGSSFGIVDGIDKGFRMKIPPEAIDNIANGRNLYVERGEVAVANLSLSGSSAGIAVLRRCAAHNASAREARARREARVEYLARDPFAPTPENPGAAGPVASGPPRPPVISNPSWSAPPRVEFPQRAADRGIQSGSVQIECTVNSNGSLSSCTVISETPSGAGFGASALAAARVARLSPRSVDSVAANGKVRFTQFFSR